MSALVSLLVLVVLGAVAFVQNMAFTAVSRSRNSGDVRYHAGAAVLSNGIWFFCQVLIVSWVWRSIEQGNWLMVVLAGAVYTACTTAGSCLMMHRMLRRERGLRRVGANPHDEATR